MRALSVALLLSMIALSGCFGGDDAPDNEPGDGDGHEGHGDNGSDDLCLNAGPGTGHDAMEGNATGDESGNETTNDTETPGLMLRMQPGDESGNGTTNETGNETAPAETATRTDANGCEYPNTPPTATVGVDILTAAAPVDIAFNFDAHDADGDNLTWTLDVDGDGVFETEGNENNLPGNFTFTFEEAGNFTARFLVSDGDNETEATAVFNVQDPVPEADPFIFEAYFSEGCPQCSQGANTGIGWRAGMQGIDYVWTTIPAEYIGTPYFAKTTGTVLGISFRDSCDAGANVETPVAAGQTLEGTVPAGAACVMMWEQGTTRGGKHSFIADGDNSMFPADPVCYTNDFIQIGFSSEGVALYQTDGTWVYAEGNGIPGVQFSGIPEGPLAETHAPGCENGDTMII